YDQLIVLKNTRMPAVLLEAGSIINRDEELQLGSPERQALIVAGVADAGERFCASRHPRAPHQAARRPAAPTAAKTPVPPAAGTAESGEARSGGAGPSTGIESMSDITRRDFLNGVALGIAAGLTPLAQVRAEGARYPPALTGMRGQHAGAFEVAHDLAAGKKF